MGYSSPSVSDPRVLATGCGPGERQRVVPLPKNASRWRVFLRQSSQCPRGGGASEHGRSPRGGPRVSGPRRLRPGSDLPLKMPADGSARARTAARGLFKSDKQLSIEMGHTCPVSRSEATGSRALPGTARYCGSAGFCLDATPSLPLRPRCPEQVPDDGLREGGRRAVGSTAGRPVEGRVCPGWAVSNWEQVQLCPHTGRSPRSIRSVCGTKPPCPRAQKPSTVAGD